MGSTFYMRESFAEGLLRRKSLPQSKFSARLRLNVLCWCIFEACKYSRNVGRDDVLSTALLAAKSILQIVHL